MNQRRQDFLMLVQTLVIARTMQPRLASETLHEAMRLEPAFLPTDIKEAAEQHVAILAGEIEAPEWWKNCQRTPDHWIGKGVY